MVVVVTSLCCYIPVPLIYRTPLGVQELANTSMYFIRALLSIFITVR